MAKKFRKIYLEISNVCNLRCSFCPGTKRTPGVMSPADFAVLLPKLRPWSDYLYFHIMGEPLCHPHLGELLALAADAGFRVILTTNGTLLPKTQNLLLSAKGLHKVNISLHAFEANDLSIPFTQYLDGCFDFGEAAQGKLIVTYRLWNNGGYNQQNDQIITALHQAFPSPWETESRGIRIADRVYLEHGDKFDWPDLSAQDYGDRVFCYGLRDQIGVLCDGTVVPCCLDHEGDIPLGNLFRQDMEQILASPRARNLYDGFSKEYACEPLCRRCGYAQRFHK